MSAIGSEGKCKDQLVMSALGTGLGAVFLPGWLSAQTWCRRCHLPGWLSAERWCFWDANTLPGAVTLCPREPSGYLLISLFLSLSSCPFLARQLTLAIPIIAAILFFFVMSCLLQTSFTDPGILPRATVCEAAALEKQIGEPPTLPAPHSLI